MPAEPPPLTPLLLPLPLAIATTVVADAEYVAEPAIPARRPCPALAWPPSTLREADLWWRLNCSFAGRKRDSETARGAGGSAAATRAGGPSLLRRRRITESRLRAKTCDCESSLKTLTR